jgi:hypothetical protein
MLLVSIRNSADLDPICVSDFGLANSDLMRREGYTT